MALSARCIETLLDLAENKLSQMEITDREDAREKEILERCILELRAEAGGQNGHSVEFQLSRRRGRRPKNADPLIYPAGHA